MAAVRRSPTSQPAVRRVPARPSTARESVAFPRSAAMTSRAHLGHIDSSDRQDEYESRTTEVTHPGVLERRVGLATLTVTIVYVTPHVTTQGGMTP